ncbi:hypothetical protein R1sor_017019 [Riccia sorocarpa]|uniref:Rubredoxin-like domain-containing protein n=1 Tax=Riccia sorocarpa TaxID=122646 RepID=A0ABD3I9L2_9MARC
MAAIQSVIASVSASSLSSVATFSATGSRSSSGLQVRAWTRPTARRVRGLSIRAESDDSEYESPARGGAFSPGPPSTAPGVSGTEAPTAVYTKTTPIEQGGVPKEQRLAYICQSCGYIYDLDTPFEEQDDATYACPVCNAAKSDFIMSNTTLGEEPYDVTRDDTVDAKPDSEKSGNMN